MEVNKMLLDEDITISQLSGAIEKDQAMVSKILKLVNSAFFGLRGKISNISHAVVVLGFDYQCVFNQRGFGRIRYC